MKKPLPKLLSLFLTFLKIGAFTFGGGYAMISLLENEFVSKKQWIDKEEFLDILAVSESTPGPIAVNTATFIGYKVGGALGSFLATLAVCLPSFTIIFLISLFFDRFLQIKWVGYAFRGIQVAVVYLIASAGIKILRGLKKNVFNVVVAVAVFACFILLSLFAVRFSSIFYILIAGALGLTLYFIGVIRNRGKEK
ncbi:MAG: chromate transporter [Clostridia bacterium]|nr:chromate transporter [Clostridia bacterium]